MYSDEELEEYWPSECPQCGWHGLSREGVELRDRIVCPVCYEAYLDISGYRCVDIVGSGRLFSDEEAVKFVEQECDKRRV